MKHTNDGYGFCSNCNQALITGWEKDECVPIPDVPGMSHQDRFRLVAIQNLALMGAPVQPAATKWVLQLLAAASTELKKTTEDRNSARMKLADAENEVRRLATQLDDARTSIRHYAQAAQGSKVQ